VVHIHIFGRIIGIIRNAWTKNGLGQGPSSPLGFEPSCLGSPDNFLADATLGANCDRAQLNPPDS
jgi:hypothetical protein